MSCTCFSNDVCSFIRYHTILQQPLEWVKNHTFVYKYKYPCIQKNPTSYTRRWRLFFWLYPLLYFLTYRNIFANGFCFHHQVERMSLLSHLAHLNPIYIIRSYLYHTILTLSSQLCQGISNGILPQELWTQNFCFFLPLTSTKW